MITNQLLYQLSYIGLCALSTNENTSKTVWFKASQDGIGKVRRGVEQVVKAECLTKKVNRWNDEQSECLTAGVNVQ